MHGLGNLKDRWVHFKLRDIYVPAPQEVLDELHGDDLLQGRVVSITERGFCDGTYVVVEVDGLKHAVVVHVEKIVGVI